MSESTGREEKVAGSGAGNVVPQRVKRRLLQWQWLHRAWWGIHYAVGLVGVIAGGMTALGEKMPVAPVYVGLVAAVATSLVTFLGPLTKAERYWRAFHEADQACLDYEAGHISSRALTRAIKTARSIVISGPTSDVSASGNATSAQT